MITKKMLEIVLKVEILKHEANSKAIHYDYYKDGVTYIGYSLNIFELADMVIEWIESEDFWIKKEHKQIYQLIYQNKEVYGIDTKRRIHVPFMCMKWILDNKN